MGYTSNFKRSSSDPLITVNSCGELRLHKDSHIQRYRGRQDYQLIYIDQGHCAVNLGGTVHIAHPGDCILYRPGQVQDYCYSAKDQPVVYWIHFSGGMCDRLFEDLSLQDVCIARVSHNREIVHLCKHICQYHNLSVENREIICSGLLQSVLALISNEVFQKSPESKSNAGKISELIGYAKMTSRLNMTVEECAAFCGMSKAHFTRVFKATTGLPPVQFFLRLRIDRAKELLDFTDKSILEVAEGSGFPDQNYFTRTFRRFTGMTPTQYRNVPTSGNT